MIPQRNYLAFYNGQLLPDNTLDWIIDAALRGRITPSNELKNASVQVSS